MKKVFLTCLVLVAVFAVANTASAITCTVDQRPAATLLVPYFQISYDDAGNLVSTGIGARDTIVTIANASSAPMIAHVAIYSKYSQLVLDFNVALTGFDVQAMRMSDVLAGILPTTQDTVFGDVCQKNPSAAVYPNPDGFLRVRPNQNTAAGGNDDMRFATTNYNTPAFSASYGAGLIHTLREDCDQVDGPLATGYVVIDHANYCTITNPDQLNYWQFDAAGAENNLWGEIVFTSGLGLPTYAMSTVDLEADAEFWQAALSSATPVRTFYARYWNDGVNGGLTNITPPNVCPNCGSGDPNTDLSLSSPWNVTYGDSREPLGLKWAGRWFNLGATITSNFQVWRSHLHDAGSPETECDPLPPVAAVFYDEDENTIAGPGDPGCTSPIDPNVCGIVSNNFPWETQQVNVNAGFNLPSAPAGWVGFSVYTTDTVSNPFEQAFAAYTFEGSIALESVLVPGTQLDPSSCNPLVDPNLTPLFPIIPEVSQNPAGTGP